MKSLRFWILASVFFCFLLLECAGDPPVSRYKTKNVVVLVVDGARYSEVWGDTAHTNIPHIAGQLAPHAVVSTSFYNDGPTLTVPGHAAITTGNYISMNNSGEETPFFPSFFQYFSSFTGDKTSTYLITSKDKLAVLSDCNDPDWKGRNNPPYDCGVNGPGTGYRSDTITFTRTLEIMKQNHPRLVLINLMEPDNSGHGGVWQQYIAAIRASDSFAGELWKFIQQDKYYRGTTTLFITSDHGRHLDGVNSGFVSHGCSCDGCRHLMFLAIGPDFRMGEITGVKAGLTDISTTIAELLYFAMPTSKGRVMKELFKP